VRIVLLPSAYEPAVGGVEELSKRLVSHLTALGHELEVWTNRHPPGLPQAEDIAGVAVRRFPMPLPAAGLDSLLGLGPAALATLRAMGAATRRFSPDIFHVQCFSGNGVYASALSVLFGIPLVITLQGETVMDDNDIYDTSSSLRLGLRAGLRVAKAVTGCSQFTLDDAVARFGLRKGAGLVIPNGVDLSHPDPPTALTLPFDTFVLGLGRVVEKKGFDLLIDAFHRVAQDRLDIGLVIGGDGAARPNLLAKVEKLGLHDRVVLPGKLSRGQVAWAMSNAQAFVLPSRVEPFGIVVLEAMNAGTPVVASVHGGAVEIVRNEVNGLVVDPFDSQAMAHALERVIDASAERQELVDAGRVAVGEFDWKDITRRYVTVYRAVGSRSKSRWTSAR
jgi:glycogen synthase